MPSPLGKPPNLPKLPWLYAIPTGALPAEVECEGCKYLLAQTFKHDFFAATGLYNQKDRAAVLKVGRIGGFFGLPLSWIGRSLRNREVRIYRRVADLPGVPALIGTVGPTGFMHDFVPGHPLGRDERVGDAFFDQLEALLREIHARDIAYVDLNKRQNVLVGDDGRPYLIDFQISYELPRWRLLRWGPWLWTLRRLQKADWYHFCKHKVRLRPDLATAEERRAVEHVSIWIRMHRWIARPIIQARRGLLRRIRKQETANIAGSDAK
ncbi:MAG: hypothetical protein SF069_01260 [Phycisphaerae bacterium]|nr:hypothetical protein [Phycisphaerae bacterium]